MWGKYLKLLSYFHPFFIWFSWLLSFTIGSLQLLLWMSEHCCYLFWCLIFLFLFFPLFQNMAVSNCFQKWTMLWKIGLEHCWKMIFWVLYVRTSLLLFPKFFHFCRFSQTRCAPFLWAGFKLLTTFTGTFIVDFDLVTEDLFLFFPISLCCH